MGRLAAAIAVAGLALADPGQAQEIPGYLRGHLEAPATAERLVADAMAEMRQLDSAGDGLDARDLRRAERPILAMARANNLQRVMRFDLDGDLRVSAAEARQALAEVGADGVQRQRDREVLDLAWFDADGDGDVTLQEVRRVRIDLGRSDGMGLETVRALMALPEAADGRLTEAELAAYARALFASADADGDGVLGNGEGNAAQRTHPVMRAPRTPARACRLPPLPRGHSLVLIGVAEGGGERAAPPNLRTATVVLDIASGERPLYILAASGAPVQWRLRGEVGRVARMVAMTEEWGRREGATLIEGLQPPFAQVGSAEDCVQGFVDAASPSGASAIARATAILGRAPDAVIAAATPSALGVPRGQVSPGKPPRRVRPAKAP